MLYNYSCSYLSIHTHTSRVGKAIASVDDIVNIISVISIKVSEPVLQYLLKKSSTK